MSHLRLVHDADLDLDVAGKLPPHDVDIETAVLSAVILDGNPHADQSPSALDKVSDLVRPEHFYSEANGRIFQCVRQMRTAGIPIDVVSVRAWLAEHGWLERAGGSAYLATIVDATPAIAHVETHASLLVDLWEKRQTIATCQRISAELYHHVGPWAEYKSGVRKTFGMLTAPRHGLRGTTAESVVQQIRARIQASSEAERGVEWPWPSVSRFLGLLSRGKHHVLAGRSEHGKTALMMQAVVSIAGVGADLYGFKEAVYIQSIDMSAESLLFRTACSMVGLDADLVELDRNGTRGMVSASDWSELGRALTWLGELPLIIDDEPAPPEEVGRRVRAWRAALEAGKARRPSGELYPKCRLQLIVGDHAQKIADIAPGVGSDRDRRARITAVSNGWLLIAKMGFATLLLSQMSRLRGDRESKWPRKEDLEGSGALEQDADKVFAIHAPEKMGDRSRRWQDVRALVKCKGRYGSDRRALLLDHHKGWFQERRHGEDFYEEEYHE